MLAPRFRLTFIIAFLMLLLGFVGVILTDMFKDGAWQYWRIIALVFAIVSLSLNIYLRKKGWQKTLYSIWHEVWHWVGLLLCISLISFLVKIGLISRFVASLQILTLLALSTYLIGIYIEITFVPIGIVLGFFASGIAFFDQYLYVIFIPLILLAVGALIVFFHHRHKKLKE